MKKQIKALQFRQGDVYIELVTSMPDTKTMTEVVVPGRVVLAYGEVTGHAHAIYPVNDKLPAKLWDAGAERFLQVLERTAIQHEEHGTIPLEPGIYRVSKFGIGTQREYSPEAIRTVAD